MKYLLVVSLTLNAMLGAQVYYLTRPRSVMERPTVIKVETNYYPIECGSVRQGRDWLIHCARGAAY